MAQQECNNIDIIGVAAEEREQQIQNLFKVIMTENFPNLVKGKTHKSRKCRVPNKRNPKKPTQRHITIKMAKDKDNERILKATREKQIIVYKGALIRPSADFSTDSIQARRDWREIFKVTKSKDLQPRLLYTARLSFKIEGDIKSSQIRKT